jgi:eukaryotic-like serine/threonine-protein kinase
MNVQAPVAPFIGCTFRGYRIEKLLASGGMGAVYVARDVSLPNVRKVIKTLVVDPSADEWARTFVHDRFLREALTVSALLHENIVKVHAVGVLDGTDQPCMLMDYVEGQTLHDFMSGYGARVPPYRVLPLMCHVARGLDAAHARGIVHRDLKPQNVMLCPKDNDPTFCVLLDFGMAKVASPMASGLPPTMSGVGLGTPSYMAVEQFKHADEATPLSDVYALAIMIWEMVTGDLPWGRHDMSTPLGVAMLYQLQRDTAPHPPPAATLPPGWERALRSALSPRPEDRPPSVRHLMVDLAVELEPVSPHVRSGVEILRSIAPRFIAEAEPDAETVRNAPQRSIVVAWPRSDSPVRVAAADLPTRPGVPGHDMRTPVAPGASPAAALTTLAASNGVLSHPTTTRAKRTMAYVVIVAAALATVAAAALVSGRARDDGPTEPLQPAAAPSAPVTTTSAPAPRLPSDSDAPPSPVRAPPQLTESVRNTSAPPFTSPPAPGSPAATAQPSTKTIKATTTKRSPRASDPGARSTTTTPVNTGKADPDRSKAHVPDPGAGRKFDPNAVGGQDDDE